MATDVGGLGEDVEHGRSGLLVPPERPDKLAAALRALIENPARVREMGAYAHHLATTRNGWSSIAETIISSRAK